MPKLYVVKVNLNSAIIDVYNNRLDLEQVCTKIYRSFGNVDFISETVAINSEIGRVCFEIKDKERISNYYINNVIKLGNGILIGEIKRKDAKEKSKSFVRGTENTVTEINFYFDVKNEIVAFCEKQNFRYKQFMDGFTGLLDIFAYPYKFELFLVKDKQVLFDKIEEIQIVTRINGVLVPPNSNDDDLRELNGFNPWAETNVTKTNFNNTSSSGINKKSNLFKSLVKMVQLGYGQMTIEGFDSFGVKISYNSNQDAALVADNTETEVFQSSFPKFSEDINSISAFMSSLIKKAKKIQ